MKLFASALVLLLAVTSAHARGFSAEEKLSDLSQLVSVMKSGYGPLLYKEQAMGLRVSTLHEKYAAKLRDTKSNREAYYLLNQFVAEFQDSHFGAAIATTHQASLPFATDLVAGKVMIDTVNRAKLPEDKFPYGKGDEIVEVDGVPIAKVLDNLQSYLGAGYAHTSRRRAAMMLTVRAGQRLPVPSGKVVFGIRKAATGEIWEETMEWTLTGEPVDEFTDAATPPLPLATRHLPLRTNYDQFSTFDWWGSELLTLPGMEPSFRCAGTTRIAIPSDATVIMSTPFVAYYHPTPKGNVGYLRIPHYSPVGADGKAAYELRLAQYQFAVSVLEKNTVGLIIDQDHNCGGSVAWLHQMVGLFMPKAFQPMQFELLASKESYLEFQEWLGSVDEHTIGFGDLSKVFNLVKKHWQLGDFLTPKTSIDGVEWIQPDSEARYTKPIVMLIDEMSGSGGDAFPALLQGYGRAKLLGTRTMGAGGHVVAVPALHYSRTILRMTKSLFYRPDGVPVENNGAHPDFPYTHTVEDFTGGYRAYQAFYLQTLLGMIE